MTRVSELVGYVALLGAAIASGSEEEAARASAEVARRERERTIRDAKLASALHAHGARPDEPAFRDDWHEWRAAIEREIARAPQIEECLRPVLDRQLLLRKEGGA